MSCQLSRRAARSPVELGRLPDADGNHARHVLERAAGKGEGQSIAALDAVQVHHIEAAEDGVDESAAIAATFGPCRTEARSSCCPCTGECGYCCASARSRSRGTRLLLLLESMPFE